MPIDQIVTASIANGAVVPADLSTGGPSWDASGNVGIGTSAAATRLQLVGTGTQELRVTANTSGDVRLGMDVAGTSYMWIDGYRASGALAIGVGNVERARIDSSGRMTVPGQLHIRGDIRNTGGSGTANAMLVRSQQGLSWASDRVVVPIVGNYMITFSTIAALSTGRIDSQININGANTVNMLSEDNGTGYHYRQAAIVIRLQANDYVQVWSQSWYDPTSADTAGWRNLSITLLS